MISVLIDFANVLLAALTVGAMFGISLILNPQGLAVHFYVALQQQAIRTVNRAMPALGAATIVMTIAAAVLGRSDTARMALLVLTAVCFAAAGAITKFFNQPINAIVMTWNSDAPPANWAGFRDTWWKWHLLRLIAAFGGLGLLIAATLKHEWRG